MTAFALPPPFRPSLNPSPTASLHRTPTPVRRLSPRAAVSPSSTPRVYETVSWPQVERMCLHLARAAEPHNFDVVLAITRGGLIPATLLCEALCLRNILSATVIFYTDSGEQFFGMTEPRFLSFPSPDALQGRCVLIVDDVWDSGRTASAVRNRVLRADAKLVKTAVLHYKPHQNQVADMEPAFFAATTKNWVLYPWERVSPETPVIDDNIDSPHILTVDPEPSINENG